MRVVGHARVAEGADEECVVLAGEPRWLFRRQRDPRLQVVIGTVRQLVPLAPHRARFPEHGEHLERLPDHLGADPVPRENRQPLPFSIPAHVRGQR